MHSLSLDSDSVLSNQATKLQGMSCVQNPKQHRSHTASKCATSFRWKSQRENIYKMTVQSQVNGAVSQSVGAAQDLLQWHPNQSESMKALAAFLLIPLFLGQIVGLLSATQIKGWYKNIHKPSWQPPAFLFGPVWSMLYILMGVGAWQVWKHGGWAAQKDALSLWVFQLIFNLFWNPLFFLKHDMSLALFDIGVLWALVIVLIGVFVKVEPLAGYLQLPYLAWVTFASVLNYTLLKLNTQPAPAKRSA